MLRLIIDIGMAVKKTAVIPQKYVLPDIKCSLLPFSDNTAGRAETSAIVPARICIGKSICILVCTFLADIYKDNIIDY